MPTTCDAFKQYDAECEVREECLLLAFEAVSPENVNLGVAWLKRQIAEAFYRI